MKIGLRTSGSCPQGGLFFSIFRELTQYERKWRGNLWLAKKLLSSCAVPNACSYYSKRSTGTNTGKSWEIAGFVKVERTLLTNAQCLFELSLVRSLQSHRDGLLELSSALRSRPFSYCRSVRVEHSSSRVLMTNFTSQPWTYNHKDKQVSICA